MVNFSDNQELIILFIFIISGFFIASIYDFFRAIRKVKKQSNLLVVIQDIIFCVLSSSIIILDIVCFLKEQIRLYLLLGILFGGFIYFSVFSKFVLKFYILILKTFNLFIEFIFLPFQLYNSLFNIMYAKLEKNVVKCCKKINDVIFLSYKNTK